MEKSWQNLKQQNAYWRKKNAFKPSRSYLYSARSSLPPLHRPSLLCLSPALAFPRCDSAHPSQQPDSPAGPTDHPALPAAREGCRPPQSLCLDLARRYLGEHPSLPPCHEPPAAAGPPALPPAPEDTVVFIKDPCSQTSIYKQKFILAKLTMKQTFHKCRVMRLVRRDEPVDQSNAAAGPRYTY